MEEEIDCPQGLGFGPDGKLYVVSFLLLVPMCLMNLVTAAIVENALAQAAADREVNQASAFLQGDDSMKIDEN